MCYSCLIFGYVSNILALRPIFYGLCTIFLPGNTHLILGTREGHLLVIDIAAGDVVYVEENAHDGAIWSIVPDYSFTVQPHHLQNVLVTKELTDVVVSSEYVRPGHSAHD